MHDISPCLLRGLSTQMAAREEFDRNENVYKQVALQEAEERQLRDQELERMRLEWMEQMRVRVRMHAMVCVHVLIV